jgi:competence protein ComFB
MNTTGLRNLIEDHAAEAYDRIVGHYPAFCGCEACRLDVLVFALNRLPPRYVIGLEGTIVTGLNLEKDQARASIDVAVIEGIRKVHLAPRCERRRGG